MEKVTYHMRGVYAKADIKLKHNFMNTIAYKAQYNEHVAPP
jgi:hypothetical protein